MKPILFNTEMVRAILGGRKTVTRRVVKPQPRTECNHGGDHEFVSDNFGGKYGYTGFVCRKCGYGVSPPHCKYPCGTSFFRPPYHPGDVLYVRETFFEHKGRYYYKADEKHKELDALIGGSFFKWHPSIHMPKEAARIFLRVTGVGVERLQDMTMSDILAEGVVPEKITGGQWQDDYMKPVWDTTIKPADLGKYGWNANPWVWVIQFERCEKPEEV